MQETVGHALTGKQYMQFVRLQRSSTFATLRTAARQGCLKERSGPLLFCFAPRPGSALLSACQAFLPAHTRAGLQARLGAGAPPGVAPAHGLCAALMMRLFGHN
jgi:hypothetical protein